ncbi:DUF4153 domain-containing protein [Oceanobacillus rekensis]|uniref:DUF4153 domain-containing protein n=1 Tax=Oceanobacillus rekensis TaxID=937927 RepID=UPI000B451E33|nr:DUF4173 domain-containing protein [Oceanobacillus rekensis]
MEIHIKGKDLLFLLTCLGLGILAEFSFFHGKIGLSYPVFITGFYLVLFLRFRLSFNHRRIGLLLMVAIWILAGGYLFYDNDFFHALNLLIIPILVFFHIVLITSTKRFRWSKPEFITLLTKKFQEGLQYNAAFCKWILKKSFKNMNEQTAHMLKRIFIGLMIGVPLLLLVIGLLMSADAIFQDAVLHIPEFILQLNFIEEALRIVAIILLTLLFFGIFQVLQVNEKPIEDSIIDRVKKRIRWDSVTAVTILVLLNTVYVLFVAIQFTYFFSEGLQDGLTYAEYARRGFFELIFVTLINWAILISFLKLVKEERKGMKLTLKVMYSFLIVMSGVMLISAFQRLSMYEAAYGFTVDRILAHAFMIYLIIIFAYTLIRVWMERLTLLHFYLIAGLTFYTGLNAMNIEQIIVDNNLDRYEDTGKIDIDYLNSLSYTGLNGLIELYEMEREYPELENILNDQLQQMEKQSKDSWQAFNFTRQEVTEKIRELDIGH